jgi:hypothetical protein
MAVTGEQLVQAVRKYLGVPYVYGGTSPSGFDCSGLIQYAFEQAGVKDVPRTSEAQWAWPALTSVQEGNLQPGDLIFSDWPGDDASPGHVAVYAGGNQLIEAPRPGESVHQITLDPNYKAHVKGYKRLTGTAPGIQFIDTPAGSGSDSGAQTAASISGLATDFAQVSDLFSKLLLPSTWVRIVCALLGAGALIGGLLMLRASVARQDRQD